MAFDKSRDFAESRNESGFVCFIQDDKHYDALGNEVTPDGKKIIKENKPKKDPVKTTDPETDAQLAAQLAQ